LFFKNCLKGNQSMRRKSNNCPEGQFGPLYNVTGQGLDFYRKKAKGGLASMSTGFLSSKADRQAYGAAVEAAVREMQAKALRSLVFEQSPSCASGSWDEYPSEAVRRQQLTALLSYPAKVRKARTAQEWESLYVAAMPQGFVPSWEREATAPGSSIASND
jgi:hypothetical protein